MGFPGESVVMNPHVSEDDLGLIHGLRRSPEGHGSTLQCSCLGNAMDQGALWASVHGVMKSLTR